MRRETEDCSPEGGGDELEPSQTSPSNHDTDALGGPPALSVPGPVFREPQSTCTFLPRPPCAEGAGVPALLTILLFVHPHFLQGDNLIRLGVPGPIWEETHPWWNATRSRAHARVPHSRFLTPGAPFLFDNQEPSCNPTPAAPLDTCSWGVLACLGRVPSHRAPSISPERVRRSPRGALLLPRSHTKSGTLSTKNPYFAPRRLRRARCWPVKTLGRGMHTSVRLLRAPGQFCIYYCHGHTAAT